MKFGKENATPEVHSNSQSGFAIRTGSSHGKANSIMPNGK